MKNSQIITIKEFRKIVGKDADGFSDDEIEEYINKLDLLAELYIKRYVASKEVNDEAHS